MNLTLISFLGNPPSKRQGGERRYELTNYRFPGEECVHQGHEFAGALLAHLRGSGNAPSRMLICGTFTSNWYAMAMDSLDASDESFAGLLERLRQHTDAGSQMSEEDLSQLAQAMSTSLGLEVRVLPIGFCQTQEQQLQVVRWLSDHVDRESRLVLDITHGFRHLPLIGFAAVRYLELVRACVIESVVYGMFAANEHDPNTGESVTPVVDLKGMLRIIQVGEGFAAHESSGLLGPMAKVLAPDLPLITKVAFSADIGMPEQVRESALAVRQNLAGSTSPLVQAAAGSIDLALAWSDDDLNHHERQRANARRLLSGGNYVASILFLWESLQTAAHAFIEGESDAVKRSGTHNTDDLHRMAHNSPSAEKQDSIEVDRLRDLRNDLAHSSQQPKASSRKILGSPATLESYLNETFRWADGWAQRHSERLQMRTSRPTDDAHSGN